MTGAPAPTFRFTCPRCSMTSSHPKDAEEGYCGNCHDWTAQGLKCPGCGRHAALQVFGQMAMCGSEDCRVIYWDPDKPILEQEMTEVDLTPLIPPDQGKEDPPAT